MTALFVFSRMGIKYEIKDKAEQKCDSVYFNNMSVCNILDNNFYAHICHKL